jgi:pimeloyl-ACP methyl ester carboxylesterase
MLSDQETKTDLVRNRSVFLIGGYEPKSSDAFFKRTRREIGRFCETWQVDADLGDELVSDDGLLATGHVSAAMPEGQVDTDINFFVWNDIVLSDFSKPTIVRVAKYLLTFCDYLVTGTFFRIVKQAWRFSLYFLYPFIALSLITCLAIAIGFGVSQIPVSGSALVGALIAVAAWYGMLKYSGRRWFVLHLMDLWSFSRGYLREKRHDAREHVDRYAQAVVDRYLSGKDDEIVLVGHSTGGALILDIASTAISKCPSLGADKAKVTVLTVGSTALKIGLHPAAAEFRKRVQRIVDTPSVDWIECQAMTDVINFYKTDPVKAMQLPSQRQESFPKVHVVRIRDMLQPEIYKKFRYNFFRVHYQFIMANTRQYAYDFFMMCCGERPFSEKLGKTLRKN